MFKPGDYPKRIWLKGEEWEIKFVRHIGGGDRLEDTGEFDSFEQRIRIKVGQSREQLFKTVAHELIHLGEHAYGFEIPHATISKIEDFLYDLLSSNL